MKKSYDAIGMTFFFFMLLMTVRQVSENSQTVNSGNLPVLKNISQKNCDKINICDIRYNYRLLPFTFSKQYTTFLSAKIHKCKYSDKIYNEVFIGFHYPQSNISAFAECLAAGGSPNPYERGPPS